MAFVFSYYWKRNVISPRTHVLSSLLYIVVLTVFSLAESLPLILKISSPYRLFTNLVSRLVSNL